MTIQFDEKGKFFTEIVTKNPSPVIVQTITNRVHGNIFVRPGERLKDALDQSTKFVAVTDAVIFGLSGEELYHTEFIVINIEHIIWLIPDTHIDRNRPEEGDAP